MTVNDNIITDISKSLTETKDILRKVLLEVKEIKEKAIIVDTKGGGLPMHLRKALNAVGDNLMTASTLAEKLNMTRGNASRYLNDLEIMGLLKKSRSGREVYFRIVEK
jgi:DNA-binding transcriptional ArsR family regulator